MIKQNMLFVLLCLLVPSANVMADSPDTADKKRSARSEIEGLDLCPDSLVPLFDQVVQLLRDQVELTVDPLELGLRGQPEDIIDLLTPPLDAILYVLAGLLGTTGQGFFTNDVQPLF